MGNGASETLLLIILLAAIVVPFVFYLLTLQRAFEAVSEANRELTPGLVWLMFIPIFGLGWYFVVVIKLANSIKKEYETRGMQEACSGGFGVGVASAICSACSVIPTLAGLAGLATLVLFIIHWVQISGFKGKLVGHQQ
jgi:hypothetical protein